METASPLSPVWRHETIAPAVVCADVRRRLGPQVRRHRLRCGFTGDDVRVSDKTGILLTIRNEVVVVEFAGRSAVAVRTRAEDARGQVPARDAFTGPKAGERLHPESA